MKITGSQTKESMKDAGYRYIRYKQGYHILLNTITGIEEAWIANKNHSGYAIAYKNTDLEFMYSIKA